MRMNETLLSSPAGKDFGIYGVRCYSEKNLRTQETLVHIQMMKIGNMLRFGNLIGFFGAF
jgi:hypothetical protein